MGLRIPLLRGLRRSGVMVSAVGSNPGERELFKKEGIPFYTYRMETRFGPFSELKSFLRLYRIFKRQGFGIVHAFDTRPTIIARIAARLAGTPVVVGTITGLGKLFSGGGAVKKRLSSFYTLGQRAACALSDMTVFQNEDDREFFLKKGVTAADKTRVIPGSGVDTQLLSPESVDASRADALRKELGLEGRVVITMACRLVKYKGVEEFLKASRIVKERHSQAVFLLAGPTDDTPDAFPLEKLSGFSDSARYIGSRTDIREVFFLSDMVTLPSYYREGVPRVLLEAASLGKPIVTTDMPGCRDAVEDGVNGFTVPPRDAGALADALCRLVEDEGLRKRAGRESRRIMVEKFDLKIVLEKTLGLYTELMDNETRHGAVEKPLMRPAAQTKPGHGGRGRAMGGEG